MLPARGSVVTMLVLGLIAPPARAQRVRLEIKPQVGDTLRMRLDQESEMTGVRRTRTAESSAMMVNTMHMFSRAIVENGTDDGRTVLAVTDSVQLSTSDDASNELAAQAEAQLRGQRVRFRVAPDGTVSMLQRNGDEEPDGAGRSEVAQAVSLMPAAFPRTSIAVGEAWTRDMPLPAGTQLGAQLSGRLHVTFRLDSVTHHRGLAYVSMHGTMRPATGPGAASAAVLENGLVDGVMLIDQKRGWLTESRFNIVVNSTVTPPPSTGIISMHVQMRITQHMLTMPHR
jgi:hypothetical protein